MTRIRCWEDTCVFNQHGICGAKEMEYHPDRGCLTYEERDADDGEADTDWEDDLEEEEEEWELDEDWE